MSKGASQCSYWKSDAPPSSYQEIPGDDQGASDEDLGDGVNGGAYPCRRRTILQLLLYRGRSEIRSCQWARPRLLSQPRVHVSCHHHRVRCRFVQYCSSASHVPMSRRRLYVSRDPYARDAQPPFSEHFFPFEDRVPTFIVALSAFLALGILTRSSSALPLICTLNDR